MTQEEYYKHQEEAKRVDKKHSVGFAEQVEGFCIYCNAKPATDKDHFFPLQGYRRKMDYINFIKANNKGHASEEQIDYVEMIFSDYNLVPCCKSCNSYKWSIPPIDFNLFGKTKTLGFYNEMNLAVLDSNKHRLSQYWDDFIIQDIHNIHAAGKPSRNRYILYGVKKGSFFEYKINDEFDDFIKHVSLFQAYNRLKEYFGVDDFMHIPLVIKRKSLVLK